MLLGKVIMRAILFPYSNKLITSFLDQQLNAKFGQEFSKILEKANTTIQESMLGEMTQGSKLKKLEKMILLN